MGCGSAQGGEIVSLASPEPGAAYTAHGVLPDTDTIARGACKPARTEVESVGSYQLELGALRRKSVHTSYGRPLVLLRETGWSLAEVRAASREAARIPGQCGIDMRCRHARYTGGARAAQVFSR